VFDVGLGELAVIAVIAVLVMGPEKLPDLARQAARLLKRLREMATSTRDDIRSELGPEYADLQLRDLDPRAFVRKQLNEALAELDAEEAAEKAGGAALAEGQLPPYDPEAT
jgi:sec-independent protein translocase protein TatB